MPIMASDKGGERKLAPAGTHQAICYGIVDLGTQPSDKYDPRRQVLLQWELPEERLQFTTDDGQEVDKPVVVSRRFTLSLHKKAALRGFLEAWRGRPFTEAELKGFDLENVLRKNCLLTVVHTEDGKYANVASAIALPKRMESMQPEREPLYFTLDDVKGPACEFPEHMPEWIQGLILQSLEYGERFSSGGSDGQPPPHQDSDGGGYDDDIPFMPYEGL